MPGAEPSPRNKSGKAKQAAIDAEYYVTIADYMVQGMVGPEAAINPAERHLTVTGLSDLLQKSDSMQRLAGYMNPFALVMGVGLWGARAFVVYREKHPAKPKARKNQSQVHAPVAATAEEPVPGDNPFEAAYPAPATAMPDWENSQNGAGAAWGMTLLNRT